jgi:outer membrane protein OmpA-like peptidoglycan-associated protein
MVDTTKKNGSGFAGPSGVMRRRISASPVITLAAALALAGCSSVPDALNPVEWYEGTTDTVGGWFSDDEPQAAGTQANAPTGSDDSNQPFPNLASVPERPTPSTTEEERAAIQQGLVADRDSARYTDSTDASAPAAPPRPRASAPQSAALPASPPPRASVAPPSDTAAVTRSTPPPTVSTPAPAPAPAPTVRSPEPAPAPQQAAAPASSGGETSGLWPRRPVPERESITPMTTGRVSDEDSKVLENPNAPTRALASEPRMPATTEGAAAQANRTPDPTPSQTGRSLDSAGNQATARPTTAPSATTNEGPEITRTLISTRTVQRTADGEVASDTVTRADGTTGPGPSAAAPNAPSPSVAPPPAARSSAPTQQAAAPTPSAPLPATDSAADQSPSVIVDGPALDQYQMGFTGPAYLVGTVNFAHGSSALSADDLDMIRSIASAAQETDAYIRVIGHASARTAEMELANHELVNFQESLARAERVGDALVRAGVPRERVLVEAMSASQPLFYESMPSGEAGNRRAEILFQY